MTVEAASPALIEKVPLVGIGNEQGECMWVVKGFLLGLTCLVILPAAAYGQASITGVVKDCSGAVLPGVTVEAASTR